MHLERIDPLLLDDATAGQLAEAMNASARAVGQRIGPMTAEGVITQSRYTHDDRPYDAMWLAREDGGAVLGTGWVDLPRWDNDHLALVFCVVHPKAWGRGIGAALLDAQ